MTIEKKDISQLTTTKRDRGRAFRDSSIFEDALQTLNPLNTINTILHPVDAFNKGKEHVHDVVNFVEHPIDSLKNTTRNEEKNAREFFHNPTKDIKKELNSLNPINTIKSGIDDVKTSVRSIEDVIGEIGKVGGKVLEVFEQFFKFFESIGENLLKLVEGMASGLDFTVTHPMFVLAIVLIGLHLFNKI